MSVLYDTEDAIRQLTDDVDPRLDLFDVNLQLKKRI